jgi:small subunit ribosomal protein S20
MANTKSATKNARKSAKRMLRNKAVKTRLKSLAKQLETATKSGDAAAAKSAAIAYVAATDKAVRSGVVHANAAGRVKAHAAKVIFAK